MRAIRVWPAQDYTRITIETGERLRYTAFSLPDPERFVLDLEAVDITSVSEQLTNKIADDDPYIRGLRSGRFKPGVVRLVVDLKTSVKPQVFTLPPVGEYGHRLVLDLYPPVPPDPLIALLEGKEKESRESAAKDSREGASKESREGASKESREGASKESRENAQAETAPAPPRTEPRAEPRRAERRPVTIVVDAGHGGEDPGARGRRGTHEKQVTLAIARRLKTLINAERNMRAVLTRDGDYFIPLVTRVEKARQVKADLFVSVHADAFMLPHARGASVFAPSERGATSAAASWLAKRENEADLIGGVNIDVKDRYLAQTLLDLSQTATINDSLRVGRSVLAELSGINTLHKPQVEQAGFAVLKAPDIPSILVETAFISNPDEEKKLGDRAYQDKVARAILAGIKRHFNKQPGSPTVATLY